MPSDPEVKLVLPSRHESEGIVLPIHSVPSVSSNSNVSVPVNTLPVNTLSSPFVIFTPTSVLEIMLFSHTFAEGRPSDASGSSDPSYVYSPAVFCEIVHCMKSTRGEEARKRGTQHGQVGYYLVEKETQHDQAKHNTKIQLQVQVTSLQLNNKKLTRRARVEGVVVDVVVGATE